MGLITVHKKIDGKKSKILKMLQIA